jgi:chemotaxis methyl-accepting protein methylase
MTAGDATDDAGFAMLTAKIARERRFACGSYKDKCLRRRIAVRMRACRAASYDAYARHLDVHPEEWDKLLDALTINVTKFFRNPDVYDAIAKSVVPVLWNSRAPIIRVWSAGCASGEEPYSLAILFHQHASALGSAERAARVRVLGSDIDRRSLATAAAGAYAEHAFGETRVALRERYFSRGLPAVIAPDVRALAQFERRDLLNEPAPEGPFHLVACRNVMIYLDRPSQERLIARFHEILAPGGFLVLGKTETLFGALRDRFTVLDQRARIYRRA